MNAAHWVMLGELALVVVAAFAWRPLANTRRRRQRDAFGRRTWP